MDQNLYFQRGIQIITKINEITPQAYLVGGVVRDYLLQIPFNDIDIATSATPEQILYGILVILITSFLILI